MLIYGILFYLFATVMIFSSLAVILVKNPVHSVLWLILCFFSSAGIFMLLGAEFIASIMVIVYVGAVAVLFLFVVMMLNIDFVKLKEGFHKFLPVCLITAAILFIDLYLVLNNSINQENLLLSSPIVPTPNPQEISNTKALGMVLYTQYALPFQVSGIILLVAMIGSIVLTHRVRKNVKRQDISKQLAKTRENCIELVSPTLRKGIK